MKRIIAQYGAAALLAVVVLTSGCSTTRHAVWHPTFEAANLTDVTVVMSKSAWRARGGFLPVADVELAQALNESVLELLPPRAAVFGSTVVAPQALDVSEEELLAAMDAYGHVLDQAQSLIRRVQLIHIPVPAELSALAREPGTRHLMVVRTAGWRAGAEAQVGKVAIAVAASLLVPGYIFIPTGASSGTGVEIMLIDAEASRVLWYGQHYADLDPRRDEHVDAVVTALLMQLYTDTRIEAADLVRWPIGQHVTAWLQQGGRVSGHLERRDGLDVYLRQRDGSTETVSLTEVRSIQETVGRRIFPAQRGSQVPRQLF